VFEAAAVTSYATGAFKIGSDSRTRTCDPGFKTHMLGAGCVTNAFLHHYSLNYLNFSVDSTCLALPQLNVGF
jgi:hypothetical protein